MADIPSLLPDVLASGGRAVDQIVLSLENAVDPELSAALAARSLLSQGNYPALRSVYERLSQTSPDRADLFLALGVKFATVRMDNGRPRSHLIAVPVAADIPLTLTETQAKTLADLVHHSSGLVCREAKVFFHPVSINLENLAYAGPVALWHAHHQIPTGKKLSPAFWQNHPEAADPPLQTFLGAVESPSTGENCLHWEDLGEAEMAAFNDNASRRLFRGKYMVAPPMLLFDALDPHAGDEPDPEEVFQDLLEQTREAISKLGTDDLNAYIEESEDSMILTLCADPDHCVEMSFPYGGKAGLERAEAFMMAYDALKIAGVAAIVLNDEDVAEPDEVVRH